MGPTFSSASGVIYLSSILNAMADTFKPKHISSLKINKYLAIHFYIKNNVK